MGVLSDQLNSCDWLVSERESLCALLDGIEQRILVHEQAPNPPLPKMLSCFSKLTKVPDLIIVGQDPYPDRRATGVSFQTSGNRRSASLDKIARNLGYAEGCYPDLENWERRQNILLMNAALCNFGRCGKPELFKIWREFVVGVISIICALNPNAVVMLLGKKWVCRLHKCALLKDIPNEVYKFGHPAYKWGPTKEDWMEVENLLRNKGVKVDLRSFSVKRVGPNTFRKKMRT